MYCTMYCTILCTVLYYVLYYTMYCTILCTVLYYVLYYTVFTDSIIFFFTLTFFRVVKRRNLFNRSSESFILNLNLHMIEIKTNS